MNDQPADLICFSHLRWDFVFQRPQHLMQRFAAALRVFYIEEPIDVDYESILQVRPTGYGVTVVTPKLAKTLRPDRRMQVQCQLLASFFAAEKVHGAIAWFYTPMSLPLLDSIPRVDLVMYDCMDELSLFKDAPSELTQRENDLFKIADLVFTGGKQLYEAKRTSHSSVHCFPSGVDFCHFSKARSKSDDPHDQCQIPFPRLGFAGVIDERMDLELVAEVAALRPDWHIVMLGPIAKIDPRSLPQLANIHWLGKKDYADLPAYFGHWDLAIMPFAINDATKFISPTKTPEFLAAGLHVISTPLRDVLNPYSTLGFASIGCDAIAFVQKAQAAMETEISANRQRQIDAFLSTQSWDTTWERMASLISNAIEGRNRDQPRKSEREALHHVAAAV